MAFLARRRHKNLRLAYFLGRVARLALPRSYWNGRRRAGLERLEQLDQAGRALLLARVEHYLLRREPFELPPEVQPLRLWSARSQRNYHHDLLELLRYFPPHLRAAYRFGDETDPPAIPTLVKARAIGGDTNSVLLKLNRVRHFTFADDRRTFEGKRPTLVWRGRVNRPHRREFLERWFQHPLCDVGEAHHSPRTPQFVKPFLGIDEQLEHRFVLSIEGHDVATNLKWILSSNSLCFMRRPRFETWFLESWLRPGEHYVELADDFSDLAEKIEHYNAHPAEAQRILANAHAFVAPFRDEAQEELVSLLVLQRYFELSGQVAPLDWATLKSRA
ncbi:MAG: lipopolysaccharide A protein [Planctomycetes bacterium]|nr:lipopolysaccharide A protein [Planctomycetota bacterium]